MEVPLDHINSYLGLDLTADTAGNLLRSMQLGATSSDDGASIKLSVPPTRSDILHACDVVEDVAIAHGYNSIPKRVRTCKRVFGSTKSLWNVCMVRGCA